MRPLVLQFALLGGLLALLLVIGQHVIFIRGDAPSWLIAGFALAFMGIGLYPGIRRSRRAGTWPEAPTPPDAPASADERARELNVSQREYEVLRLVELGLSNQEIGMRLHISETTVKSHVSNLLAKLGASRRTHAVRIAKQKGLLS